MHHFRATHKHLLLVIIWVTLGQAALGASPVGPDHRLPAIAGQSRAASDRTQEEAEPPGPPLPDEGPRAEGQPQGIDGLAWQEGQAAYRNGAWEEAHRFFYTIVQHHPQSPLVPSAEAFLIELSLRRDSSNRARSEAIQAYKKLLRDHPQSQNAKRAEWRIADLYLEQGWLQEAQAAYEQSMAHSLHLPFDGNRALLGLGYTFMAMRKWADAERAFLQLRKRTDHDLLLQRATLGLAHALFRQGRQSDAQAFYDVCYRRWPKQFRLDPVALHRFASTQVELHHHASARDLMILFYNLHPQHEYAPSALLHVADGLLGTRPSQAEFFYALLASIYPQSLQATMAQMRLATLRADRMLPAGENSVRLTVAAMMHNVPDPDQSEAAYRSTLQAIAIQHAEDPLGSEALYRLAKYYEKADDMSHALLLYKEAAMRAGRTGDPWPSKASERLSAILKPWMEAALRSRDDLTLVTLFHRHGPNADQLYAQSPLLLEIADAHRRLGFSLEAVRLYQQLANTSKNPPLLEPALIGLGKTYLDQDDPQAARKVLERYRFQFPTGRYESEALELLVTAMERQQDYQSLLRLCRAWLLHHPRHPSRPQMYVRLASTFARLEKTEEAALAYEEAFKAGAPQTTDRLLAYADTLSRLNRHQQAIAAYRAVLDKKPPARQAEWAQLQTARHWHALKQYDRATVALAELGQTDDAIVNRYVSAFRGSLQAARRHLDGEGL